jgi:serine/threonine protein kinase
MIDRVGQQLGNYRITRLLGRGGFADVYLGEHVYLKTHAAVKVLQTRLSNESDMESFLNEARTIAHLSHPHIVRVLDFGVDSETPFLVMDYAPNGTLRQRYPKGARLPGPTIIPYVKHIADALQHAHDEKLVHRDIKPENVLLGRRDEILLSDFGIALIAQSSRYQSTQDVVGTVAYMSPEQIQGKPRPASDQYSLGIVVYEWLSGDRPFHGSFTELCAQHMFAPLPPLTEKVPTINPAIEQVVTIALAKDPKQRFGSIRAFANALEQAADGQTVPPTVYAPQPSPSTSVSSPPSIEMLPTPSTQVATPTPVSGSGYMPRPFPQRQPSLEAPAKKVNVWKIGKRQAVAMLVGTATYGIAGYLLDLLDKHAFDSSDFSIFKPIIVESPYSPSIWNILLGLAFSIFFFFSAEFGPWVGLVSALVGGLLADLLSGILSAFPIPWYVYAVSAILGFLPGLALFRTKGRYNNAAAIGIAVATSAIAIVIGNICLAIGDAQLYHFDFFPEFVSVTAGNFSGLILLPILLIMYNVIAQRRKIYQ